VLASDDLQYHARFTVTLAKTQAAFGTKRLRDNGVPESQGRILCMDYRDIPQPKGYFNKIVSLEMAEVGCWDAMVMPVGKC
jgi:cyclopropane fatty-acyl-phospholipid synthase-like methyltransferase